MTQANETHGGRWATTVGQEAEPHNTVLKVYVYTRENKIVTTAKLRLTRKEVRAMLAAMDRADEEQSQLALPWATDDETNVRWLPPTR